MNMRRAGRVNWLMLLGVTSILSILVLLFLTRGTPTAACGQFFTAMAEKDIDTLMKLSDYDGDQDSLRKQWDFALNEAGKYYRFTWVITGVGEEIDNRVSVKIKFFRNSGPEGLDENYQVQMVKKDGAWKVRVTELTQNMYPGLPR